MVYDYIPFMILPIYNALCKIDKDVIEAAHDLGASARVTFQKIIIPLSARSDQRNYYGIYPKHFRVRCG